MLWAAGRTRQQIGIAWATAGANLAFSLSLTPWLGLEGVVLGTTLGYLVVFPIWIRLIVDTFPVTLREIASRAWLPAYSLGVPLALTLVVANAALPLEEPLPLLAVGGGSVAAYLAVFYAVWLSVEERAFFRGLLGRS